MTQFFYLNQPAWCAQSFGCTWWDSSASRSSGATVGSNHETEGQSEHHATEFAVMAAEIEQLPDRAGFLKITSQPAWMRVSFPVYDIPKIAEPFVEA